MVLTFGRLKGRPWVRTEPKGEKKPTISIRLTSGSSLCNPSVQQSCAVDTARINLYRANTLQSDRRTNPNEIKSNERFDVASPALTLGPHLGPLVAQQISVQHTAHLIQSHPCCFDSTVLHPGHGIASPRSIRSLRSENKKGRLDVIGGHETNRWWPARRYYLERFRRTVAAAAAAAVVSVGCSSTSFARLVNRLQIVRTLVASETNKTTTVRE